VNDRTLTDIVEHLQSRFYGKYRGTVTDVGDDARIRALVPAVLGDQKTGWCLPCVPYAGPDRGIAFLPEVDSGVWIEFEGGDVSYPIWVGAYWHDGELPSGLKPAVKIIRTKGKHEIILDDDNNSMTIRDSHGNKVILDQKGIAIVREQGTIEVSNRRIKFNDDGMEVT
jgi:uncharacterized protein involved in type VI secretion and phage assembly